MRSLACVVLIAVAVPVLAEDPRTVMIMRDTDVAAVEVPLRPGVTELSSDAITVAVGEAARDSRYAALERIAHDRGLHFQPLRAKALLLPEGDHLTVIPAFSANNEERGFLSRAADEWSLSLEIDQPTGRLIETYRAKIDASGRAVVEAVPTETLNPEHADTPRQPRSVAANAAVPTKSCSYVSRLSINFGCVNPKSNPFGYYYVTTTRTGYTPDPRSPSWRACYRGSIHICPRYENSTPFTFPRCGLPPPHPFG